MQFKTVMINDFRIIKFSKLVEKNVKSKVNNSQTKTMCIKRAVRVSIGN